MRLIDADEFIKRIYDGNTEYSDIQVATIEIMIDQMPTIDAVPVRHGEWIFQRYDEITGNADYECSICHHGDTHVPSVEVNYCWHCGAKMDGKDREDVRG